MIFIDRAIYKDNGGQRVIHAYDISQEEYQEIYKGKLYCIEPGCNAELVHMDVQKNGIKIYFRTLRGSKHKESCPYEVIKVGTRTRKGTGTEDTDVTLTESHIRDILNETFKVAIGQKKTIISPNEIKRPKKSPVTKTEGFTSNGNPTVVPGGVAGDGGSGKQPYIYKKPASSLDESKIGRTLSVYGQVVDINIQEEEANIIVKHKNKTIPIYFGNPFKDNHSQEFKYLKFFKQYHESRKKLGQPVVCVAIGLIRKVSNEVAAEVMDYHNIEFDNKGLYSIRFGLEKGIF